MTTIHLVNANTTSVCEYRDLALRGLVVHDGATYGITDTEFLEFTGSDDDGTAISAWVKTGKMKFGNSNLKRFTRLYIGGTAASGLTVTTTTEELGVATSRNYSIAAWVGNLRARVEKLARGVKSRFIQLKIANVSGGAFELEQVDMQVEPIARKIADGG